MMIWLPKYRDIEMPNQKMGVSGQYRLVVKEPDGMVAKDTGWFDNIITNAGMDQLASGPHRNTMSLGTGTAAAAASDTSLQAFVQFSDASAPGGGFTPASGTQNTVSPYETSFTQGYRFSVGRLNGTFSEIGVSNTVNGTALFSRARIADAGGAPTIIAVNSTQQLDAYYTMRRYPPLTDTSNSVVIGGVTYVVTGRAGNVGYAQTWNAGTAIAGVVDGFLVVNAGATLGAITGSMTGGTASNISYGTTTIVAYTPGSYMREFSKSFDTASANVSGGIRGFDFNGGTFNSGYEGYWQYVTDVAIPKDITKTMVLNFRRTWARY